MKKKQHKKSMLKVKSETIRNLSNKDLSDVAGGAITVAPSNTTNRCQNCVASCGASTPM